ncbi:hypothetical protein D3C76_1416220 [compost metagenome]
MGGQENSVGGASGGQQLLHLRHLVACLQGGDHHHHQRRPQRHGASLGDGRLGRLRVLGQQGGNEQLAQLRAGFAFDGEEAPGPQIAMVRRAQGGAEQ